MSMATKSKTFFSVLIFSAALAIPVLGQMIDGRPSTGSSGFVYTHWQLEPDTGEVKSLGQFWVPLSGYVALQENLEARYYIAASSNTFQTGSTESDLKGTGDARFEVTRSFSKNRFFISGGVNLPTGKTKLLFNQHRAIIETLSESFLVFPMRRFGEGLGFNGTVGLSQTWGNKVAGVGISYDIIGKYTPYEGFEEYNPGDIFTAEFGLSARGQKTVLACGVNYLSYANDKMDGRKVFKQGEQVGLSVSAAYDNKEVRFKPSARYSFRGRNTRYETGSEDIRDRLKLYGDEIELGLEVGRYFRGGWSFMPLISLLHIDNNEDNYGDSKLLTYGASIGKIFSKRILVGSWFKIMTGDTDDGRIDLKGYQISVSMTAVL